jgi:hypothetical protein
MYTSKCFIADCPGKSEQDSSTTFDSAEKARQMLYRIGDIIHTFLAGVTMRGTRKAALLPVQAYVVKRTIVGPAIKITPCNSAV